STRAGTSSSTSTPARHAPRSSARSRPSTRRSTATGAPPSAWSRRSSGSWPPEALDAAGEALGVEHAAAVDDRLRREVLRAQVGVLAVVGLDDGGVDRLAVPGQEVKRLELGVGEQRVVPEHLFGPTRLQLVAQRERPAERGLLDAAAVGDPEDEHAPAGDLAEQVDGVAGHRLVDLAGDAGEARVGRPGQQEARVDGDAVAADGHARLVDVAE